MATWIHCNSCFLSPNVNRRFAVTSCGHVICEFCFQKGKKNMCLICNSQCRMFPLSEKSSTEVKSLFTSIDVTCKKYCTENGKVLQFQEQHRRRILAYYKQKNAHLEKLLREAENKSEQLNKIITEQKAYISKLENTLQNQSIRTQKSSQISISPAVINPISKSPFSSKQFSSVISPAPLPPEIIKKQCGPGLLQNNKRQPPGMLSNAVCSPQDRKFGDFPYRVASYSCLGCNKSNSEIPLRQRPSSSNTTRNDLKNPTTLSQQPHKAETTSHHQRTGDMWNSLGFQNSIHYASLPSLQNLRTPITMSNLLRTKNI
ncbi:probable E3 SUMO-protein ligase RNF212 [Erpetoichthys calabaricus]|uniref:probable E3 SUMO-protein ligase RNF212 n=1 Tax=Erpetoichthys calabaricus TaxID=27687 RepID=UPI00223470C8|nr:probable E3 SUMO-protein ligase RNF212 [Erpetoichthys calabaricus]